jgi:hypothetical protein
VAFAVLTATLRGKAGGRQVEIAQGAGGEAALPLPGIRQLRNKRGCGKLGRLADPVELAVSEAVLTRYGAKTSPRWLRPRPPRNCTSWPAR